MWRHTINIECNDTFMLYYSKKITKIHIGQARKQKEELGIFDQMIRYDYLKKHCKVMLILNPESEIVMSDGISKFWISYIKLKVNRKHIT